MEWASLEWVSTIENRGRKDFEFYGTQTGAVNGAAYSTRGIQIVIERSSSARNLVTYSSSCRYCYCDQPLL